MPRKLYASARTPNAHAIKTGAKMREIMSANPGMRPQQAFGMASHSTATVSHGGGMFINPHPYVGTGMYSRRRK